MISLEEYKSHFPCWAKEDGSVGIGEPVEGKVLSHADFNTIMHLHSSDSTQEHIAECVAKMEEYAGPEA